MTLSSKKLLLSASKSNVFDWTNQWECDPQEDYFGVDKLRQHVFVKLNSLTPK